MNSIVKRDILKTIKKAVQIILQGEDVTLVLDDLSNHVIHNASIYQDEDSVNFAIIMYALSKIYAREEGKVDKVFVKLLKQAKNRLERDSYKDYKASIKNILREITKSDKKLKLYIEQVVDQAGIKKGTKLYEQGISLAQSSSVFGVTQWELYRYVGKTKMSDIDANWRVPVKERLVFARSVFGLK